MSDQDTRILREKVEARVGPLHEVKAPSTADEAAALAREDADLFDCLFEAGRLTPAISRKGADDGDQD